MPHTTHAYPFESKVACGLGELFRRFTTGASYRAFLLVLDRNGNVLSLTFEEESPDWHAKVESHRGSEMPHLFYDPLDDGMEYIWLSWEGITGSVMERLIGTRFEEADFLPIPHFANRARKLAKGSQFPSSWGVMF